MFPSFPFSPSSPLHHQEPEFQHFQKANLFWTNITGTVQTPPPPSVLWPFAHIILPKRSPPPPMPSERCRRERKREKKIPFRVSFLFLFGLNSWRRIVEGREERKRGLGFSAAKSKQTLPSFETNLPRKKLISICLSPSPMNLICDGEAIHYSICSLNSLLS